MVRWHPPFLHVRLIDWDEENNRWIQSIVQSLKGNYNSPLFQVIAKEFLFRFQQIPSMFKDFPFCFVPCPSKNLEKDHSFYLAQSFSKLTSLPMVECLKHPKKATTQKQKLKHSRIQKKLIRLDNKIPSHHSIVFVDDILTTGATAIAAKSALKSKCIFSTWSIFWRKNKFLF